MQALCMQHVDRATPLGRMVQLWPPVVPLPVDTRRMAKALIAYAEWCGGVHDDECPSDDTCECSGKWINDGVTETVRYLEAVPGDTREQAHGQDESRVDRRS